MYSFQIKEKWLIKLLKKLKIENNNLNVDLTLRPEKISETLYYKICEFYEKNLLNK